MSELSGGQRFIRQVNDSIYELLERLGSEDGDFWCNSRTTKRGAPG